MKTHIANNWQLVHLTDRVIELRKDDFAYYRFTNRPGYVLIRGEPGMDRAMLMDLAIEEARRNDELMATMVGKLFMPSLHKVAAFQGKQVVMKRAFGLHEQEPSQRIYRP